MGSHDEWIKQRINDLDLAVKRIQANLLPHRPSHETSREALLDELQDEVARLKAENRKLRRQLRDR